MLRDEFGSRTPSAGVPEGRATGRPIRLERHAGWKRSRLDQLEVVRLASLREQPEPVPHDDGVDPQVELVDEVALEQPSEQDAAAVKLKLASRLRLELADGRLDVGVDHMSVLPGRVLERGRGHVLGQDVDAVRDRIAAVVMRPVRLPDLPRLAAEERSEE